ncbi:MAG: hypothetical protein SFX72_13955 [Isosphaeraceae bacterium]|nr:hypothetical protein [Isosphaeraceae bacterium]
MATSREVWLRRPCLRALVLIALACLVLSPAIQTGYCNEDQVHSLSRGMVRVDATSYLGFLRGFIRGNFDVGRFYPVTQVLHTGIHYVVRDATAYKTLLVVGTVLEVLVFALLVGRLTGDKSLATFAGILSAGLYQFRLSPDPVLGYYMQIQLVGVGLFFSLLALQIHLEGGRRRWLAASVMAYLLIALTYEVCYFFFLIHLALIVDRRLGWWESVRAALPFLFVVLICGSCTLVVRRLSVNTEHYVHQLGADPVDYLRAVWFQISAALPGTYLLADPDNLFHPGRGVIEFARWVFKPASIAVGLAASAAVYPLLRGGASLAAGRWKLPVVVGLLLVVLPTLPIAASPFHREALAPGKGWVVVLLQVHGVALILATGVWQVLASERGGSFSGWKCLGVATVAAAAIGLTYRVNTELVRQLNRSPLCLKSKRANLEAALHAGLMDGVPERSRVLLTNVYPRWHDTISSIWFYAQHASKVVVAVPPSSLPDAARYHEHEQFLADHGIVSRGGAPFRLRDVTLGPDSGFVLLWRDGLGRTAPGVDDLGGEFLIFVRHPRLFRGLLNTVAATPALLLAGAPPTSSPSKGREYVRIARDLPVVRSGPDWTLLSLRSEVDKVDPSSLRLVFDPAQVAAMLRSNSENALEAVPDPSTIRR